MVTILDRIASAPRVRHPEKAHRPDQEVLRKPDWIRVKAPTSKGYADTREIVKTHKLVTVCEEAGCPNIGECWDKKHATFMIMGEICTRACAFCNVATGIPTALDPDEPARVAHAVKQMGLSHVVITSVDRDDLDDGGAEHFAQVIRAIRAATPATTIEILTPDFLRKEGALEVVVAAKPDVFNHNLETVPSNYLKVRPGARYFHSIRLLQRVKELDPSIFTMSRVSTLGTEQPRIRMSKCSHCGEEGHNVRTCPLGDVEKGPWFEDPDDRWHTKVVFEEEWPGGPAQEREVPCNCHLFSRGERHMDFSDVD